MISYPALRSIDIAALIIEAGGDPWLVDHGMQCGDPGAISELARAFITAGVCTAEIYRQFDQAQARLRASWSRPGPDHEQGDRSAGSRHPITDGAEVQRVVTRLLIQQDQLPAIGADLAVISANLAEVQRFSGGSIRTLNGELQYADALIGQGVAGHQDVRHIEDSAVEMTSAALHRVQALQHDYCSRLASSITELRARHGYDPVALEAVDGDDQSGSGERGRDAIEFYDRNQRSEDEATAPENADARARLRDYATATDPRANPESRCLAGERLEDFRMAHFFGPLPTDPILGGDASTRARGRIQMQRRLEQGEYGLAAMTPDQATRTLDDGEQFARALATRRVLDGLVMRGVSRAGAGEIVRHLTSYGGPALAGAERSLSVADAKAFAKVAGQAGEVGDLVEFGMALNDWSSGGSNEDLGASTGSIVGGAAGAWAAGAAAALVAGPWTAGAVAIVGDLVGSGIGERLGGGVGAAFDPVHIAGGGKSW